MDQAIEYGSRKHMNSLPSGTVIFLFTDIENSTQLWEQYPEAMKSLLRSAWACTLADLDEHRLKGIAMPERIFQLCHPDLVKEFPPLSSLARSNMIYIASSRLLQSGYSSHTALNWQRSTTYCSSIAALVPSAFWRQAYPQGWLGHDVHKHSTVTI
jgi:hypothetical protein